MGAKIDDFENSVNRAAEAAAPQAKGALLDAAMGMSFEDAQALLKGGDTAATDYFKKKTWDQLYKIVSPYIEKDPRSVRCASKIRPKPSTDFLF